MIFRLKWIYILTNMILIYSTEIFKYRPYLKKIIQTQSSEMGFYFNKVTRHEIYLSSHYARRLWCNYSYDYQFGVISVTIMWTCKIYVHICMLAFIQCSVNFEHVTKKKLHALPILLRIAGPTWRAWRPDLKSQVRVL